MLVPHRKQCALPIRKTNSDFPLRSVRNIYVLNVKMDKVQNFVLNVNVYIVTKKGKGKVIPLQARCGPEG